MKAMRSAVLLALLFILPGYGASLSGVVKDPGGTSVPNAAVSLESPKISFSAATDAQGRFEFPSIPAGEFRLVVTHAGFEPFSRTIATGSSSAPLAITLQVAALKTVVQVSAGRSTLRNLDPNYQAMRGASPRGVYRVNNLLLTRDAARFTFRSGSFSFLPPTLGRVTAGIFIGDGNFQLNPSSEIAAKHLTQISGAGTVDEDFSSLVVYFSDSTFGEITSQAETMDESPDAHRDVLHRLQEQLRSRDWEPETYLQRIIDADDVPNLDADLLAELYNGTGGSFRAFIHGRKHPGLRFLLNPLGALPQLPAPEEVALLNFDPSSAADGVWCLSHTVEELRAGGANSAEDKRLVAPENYKIETVIGSNQHLSATCDVQFHALRGGVRAIKFDLLPELQVSRLTLQFYGEVKEVALECQFVKGLGRQHWRRDRQKAKAKGQPTARIWLPHRALA